MKTIKPLTKQQEEVPGKTEKEVMTTEQEWEEEFDRQFCCSTTPHMPCEHIFPDGETIVKDFIHSLLASQRHQLKQQVLEAVGEDAEGYTDSWGEWHNVTTDFQRAQNELRSELRERIEAVFEK